MSRTIFINFHKFLSISINVLMQQITHAQEKGGIPSDQIAGINPLGLIFLLQQLSVKADAMEKTISKKELDLIQEKYFEKEREISRNKLK